MGRPGRIVTAVLAALVGVFVAFAALGAILAACGAGQTKPQAPVRSSAFSTAPSRAAHVAPPSEPVRTETHTATPAPSHLRTPTPTSTVTVTKTRDVSEAPSNPYVYYKDCDAARAAGAAPLYRGDPGYRSELDRDGDGVACEPYHG
ncbi:excalibur calcium-binding domain-containing protein [Streptomyces galilaeus]